MRADDELISSKQSALNLDTDTAQLNPCYLESKRMSDGLKKSFDAARIEILAREIERDCKDILVLLKQPV